MSANGKRPFGAVVVAPDQPTQAVVTLLTHYVRERLELAYYPHANDIAFDRQHDFLIVLSVGDLEGVVKRYRKAARPLPLIVHIDEPEMLAHVDHAAFFPGVEIVPLPQANLTAQPDVTLKLDLFRRIVEQLEAHA